MTAPLPALVHKIDECIRLGHSAEALALLRKLGQKKIPRANAAGVATLSWRLGWPELGVRLLNPIVRPERRNPILATDEEKAEYATCLTRLGAGSEAMEILRAIDSEATPQALFYQAAVHISQWDYPAAIPLLRRYLKHREVTEYRRAVARVNLAAVLCYEDSPKAAPLLHSLVHETGVRKWELLHSNCLQLAAYHSLLQRDLPRARGFLEQAARHVSDETTLDAFFVRKWRAIAALLEAGPSKTARAGLEQIRAEAMARRHWETVRDCDRFLACEASDEKLLQYVYFGTPYEGFRRHLLRQFGHSPKLASDFVWSPLGKKSGKQPVLDLITAWAETTGRLLPPGRSLHRLATLLSTDFYRPFRIAFLFHGVFPDEHFNPVSSPPRVHQSIGLLRAWLKKNRLPLTVAADKGFYAWKALRPIGLRVGLGFAPEGAEERSVAKLRSQLATKSFSSREASAILGISKRSALRILHNAVASGTLVRIGKTAFARYRFPA